MSARRPGGDVRGQGRRRVVDLRQGRRHRSALVERAATGEQLVRDDAEGVEVGGAGGGLAEGLLGREVVRRAEHLAGLGVSRPVDGAGDAEVGELHRAVGHDEDVRGLDVAVDDAGLVGRPEGERGLRHDRPYLARVEGALALDEVGQRLTGDELHDEVGEVVLLAVVEDSGDVDVREVGGVQRLVAEAEREDLLVVQAGPKDLHRDLALEDAVAGLPDVAHAPGRDAGGQRVAVTEDESLVKPVHRGLVAITGPW
jgi:hypothetical protein